MEGQPLPDVPGSFGGGSSDPSINSAGDIVFQVYTSERPQQRFEGIFEYSNGSIHKVVDFGTTVPGAPGESFYNFYGPQINDQGQILFGADLVSNAPGPTGPVEGGLYLMSSSGLNALALTVVGSNQVVNNGSFSINNRGATAYLAGKSITVASGNSATSSPLGAETRQLFISVLTL